MALMIRTEHSLVMPARYQRVLADHFGTDLDWQLLSKQGSRHSLYNAHTSTHSWVARIAPDTQLPLGVDPHREAQVIAAISCFEWGIDPSIFDPLSGFMLMQHLGFHHPKEQLDQNKIDQLINAINEMHGIEDLPALNYQALLMSYREAFEGESDDLITLLDETESAMARLPEIGEALVHHDLHTGNLLWGPSLSIVDWEYAGRGNPWLDYASVVSEIGLEIKQLTRFDRLKSLSVNDIAFAIANAIEINDRFEKIWRYYLDKQVRQTD